MKNSILIMTMAMLGFAVTTITLFSHQEALADKPSNPNCVGEEFSSFAKNTPRGAGDDASALAHQEGPTERRGLGDDVRDFREGPACDNP
jgi:hypothetical protein